MCHSPPSSWQWEMSSFSFPQTPDFDSSPRKSQFAGFPVTFVSL